jgi:hypothetical protein
MRALMLLALLAGCGAPEDTAATDEAIIYHPWPPDWTPTNCKMASSCLGVSIVCDPGNGTYVVRTHGVEIDRKEIRGWQVGFWEGFYTSFQVCAVTGTGTHLECTPEMPTPAVDWSQCGDDDPNSGGGGGTGGSTTGGGKPK